MFDSLLKLAPLQGLRTKLGAGALILLGLGAFGSALNDLASTPIDLLGAKQSFAAGVASVGAGLAALGIRFKNDAPTVP